MLWSLLAVLEEGRKAGCRENRHCGSAGKESACNMGDLGSIPWLGRSSGKGKGYPFQYSGLENSMDCMGSQRVRHDWATFTFPFCSQFMLVPLQFQMTAAISPSMSFWYFQPSKHQPQLATLPSAVHLPTMKCILQGPRSNNVGPLLWIPRVVTTTSSIFEIPQLLLLWLP